MIGSSLEKLCFSLLSLGKGYQLFIVYSSSTFWRRKADICTKALPRSVITDSTAYPTHSWRFGTSSSSSSLLSSSSSSVRRPHVLANFYHLPWSASSRLGQTIFTRWVETIHLLRPWWSRGPWRVTRVAVLWAGVAGDTAAGWMQSASWISFICHCNSWNCWMKPPASDNAMRLFSIKT